MTEPFYPPGMMCGPCFFPLEQIDQEYHCHDCGQVYTAVNAVMVKVAQ